MKGMLTTILATGAVPADLAVTYDDMPGMWVGTTITVRGDGSMERHTKALGAVAAQVRHNHRSPYVVRPGSAAGAT